MKFRSRVALGLGLPDDERAFAELEERIVSARDERELKRANLFMAALKSPLPERVLGDALLNADLRLSVAIAIVRLGEPGVDQLCNALTNPDSEIRSIAIEYLVHYATHSWQYSISRKQARVHLSKAVPELVRILATDTHKLRIEAAEALDMIGDNSAVDQLITTSTDENVHVDIRYKTTLALGSITDERVVQPLLDLLSEEQKSVRIAALRALANAATAPSSHYSGSERALKARAERVYELIKERAIEPIASMLRDPNKKVSITAISTLGSIATPRVVAILLGLSTSHRELRDAVISSFSWTIARQKGIEELLLDVLSDPTEEKETRLSAMGLLPATRSKRAFDVLHKALSDTDEEIREAAIEALGALDEKRAVEVIIAIAIDKGETGRLRRDAVDALRQLRDKRAVEPLLALLSDEVMNASVVRALGWLRDERAVMPLIGLLYHEEKAIRDRAATSLGLLGDSRALPRLTEMLQTEEVDVRADTARALGRIGDPTALPALEWVRDHDADICCSTYEARDAAANAIRNIKRRKRNRGLTTLAKDINLFSDDFMPQREQPEEQLREPAFD